MTNTTDLNYQPFLREMMFSALLRLDVTKDWKELKLYATNFTSLRRNRRQVKLNLTHVHFRDKHADEQILSSHSAFILYALRGGNGATNDLA